MSLFETDLGTGRTWGRVGDYYAVTKKPRGFNITMLDNIPFSAMDAIPQGGAYNPSFTMKAPQAITSGTYFERGDILVAKITPCFENGKQALVRTLPTTFGYATTEVIPLHPNQAGHDPRLLFFYLLHPDVRHHVAERMEGATGRQRVPESVLLELPIPQIEPSEQSSIADALEIIQYAAAAELNAEKTGNALKRTTMRELFTRGLRGEALKETEIGSVPESWEVAPIGSLFSITQGLSLKRNLSTELDGTPFLRTSNVYWGEIDLTTINRMHVAPCQVADRMVEPGDLLVCEGGEIGRAAVWQGKGGAYTYQNHLHRLRPLASSRVDPRFAMAWLDVGFRLRSLYEGAGNKTTIPNLPRSRLASLLMPVADIEEQREIAAILDAIDRKITLHREKRAVLQELFQSLLHKLMTGEIRAADLNLSALPTEVTP